MEKKICKYCSSEIPKNAKVCPKCQKDLRNWFVRHWIISVLLFIFIGMPFLTGIIEGLTGTSGVSNSLNNQISNQYNTPGENEISEKENWEYHNIEDRMTKELSNHAITQSLNKIYFEFPYNGGSTFTLQLSKKENTYIALVVSKGQFYEPNKKVRVKFDDEETFDMYYQEPSDASNDTILFGNPNFRKKLYTSKKLMIEAGFYNQGKEVIEFNIEGLDWEK